MKVYAKKREEGFPIITGICWAILVIATGFEPILGFFVAYLGIILLMESYYLDIEILK